MTTRQRVAIIAGSVFVVTIAVTLVLVLRHGRAAQAIVASGTVEAREADLGFQMPGRIDSVYVDEGVEVHAGDTLAVLDRREVAARRNAAAAQAAAARARLTELERGSRPEDIEQARAAVRAADQRLADATRELGRTERLYAGGAVSEQQLEARRTAHTVAQADADAARERLALAEQGPRREQIAAQREVLGQAEAQVTQQEVALANAGIASPFDGVVTVRHREPGETVGAGAPVLTVMNPNDRWIRIYVREDEVGKLTLGMPAEITADAYPDQRYAGAVTFIADEAEFTPRNVQTTAERVKLVYRVRVKITSDSSFDLKPGLPADVRVVPAAR